MFVLATSFSLALSLISVPDVYVLAVFVACIHLFSVKKYDRISQPISVLFSRHIRLFRRTNHAGRYEAKGAHKED